eukprot:TRINITY_DN28661_c0_g2_i1.p1 TRINITY_DN28661_c0_g2~~TRINITY_DN28661_c0_g2_i1.p1  ORF type:complete len:225 (-),score=27.80 TRINITY_DN28661_c0_g2_i1:268-942(-)
MAPQRLVPMRVNVDFRVRNTFIEWMPAPEVRMTSLTRCPTWDGILSQTSTSTSMVPLDRYYLENRHIRHDGIVANENAPETSINYDVACTGQEVMPSRSRQKSQNACSPAIDPSNDVVTQPSQFASEESVTAIDAEEHMHKQPGRRPCKKYRLICQRIMEYLLALDDHDKDLMCCIASKLAAESSYMRGLCFKHKIPMQAERDLLKFKVPKRVRFLWAQVSSFV